MYSERLFRFARFLIAAMACILFCVSAATAQDDCNYNDVPDADDIVANPAIDCDGNGIPDDCEIPIGGMDSCADAFDVCPTSKFGYLGSLFGMTLDGSSSCDNGEVGSDVWYAYRAEDIGNTTANVTVSLGDYSFTGMILSVHTGCPGTTENEVICHDMAYRSLCSGYFHSEVTFDVTPGETYYIRIAARVNDAAPYWMNLWGHPCASGVYFPEGIWDMLDRNRNGRLDVCDADCNQNMIPDFEEIKPGAADACAEAGAICSYREYTGTLDGATNDGSSWTGDARPDVWYSYTPVSDGNVEVCLNQAVVTNSTVTEQTALGGSIDLSAHTGCPGTVENMVGTMNGCLAFEATAGETYHIRIAVDEGYTARYEFELRGPECKAPGGKLPTKDCNGNGIPDDCDLAAGTSMDCNENGVPDECDLGDELVCTGSLVGVGDKIFKPESPIYQLNPLNADTAAITAGSVYNYPYSYGAIAIEPGSGDFLTVDLPDTYDMLPLNGYTPQAMYRVNRATGEITTLTNLVGDAVLLGMTFAQDGTLYGSVVFEVDEGREEQLADSRAMWVGGIVKLDPVNGGILEMLDTNSLCIGMGTSPDGTLYAVGIDVPEGELLILDLLVQNLLYTIDPVSGAVTSEVPLSVPTDNAPYRFVHAIAFGQDGTLYGLSQAMVCEGGYVTDKALPSWYGVTDIVTIDPVTGLVTRIAQSDRLLFGLGGPIVEGSRDCNDNDIPDECEVDCNTNGVADECDIRDGTSTDCNENGIPDECDAALALGACPENISLQAADEAGIIVTYTIPETSGGCNPLVTVVPPSGSLFPIGQTTVTVTATDELGATLSCSFTVEVLSPDAPGPQPTPGTTPQFCLPFLFQTTCGIPLCAGPCFFGGLLSSVVGIFGLRVLVRRKFRHRR